jgi:hypothetical protein
VTLLDELRPPRSDGRLGGVRGWSWRRRSAAALASLVVVGGVAAVAYVERLDPIEFGNTIGPGSLAVISDGVSDTGWLLRSAASPASATISIANKARLDVRILSVGDGIDTQSPISMTAVTRYEDVYIPGEGHTDRAVPFAPFTLHPGESVALDLKVIAGHCSAGHAVASDVIPVRWSLGWRQELSWVALPYPIKRLCAGVALKPQLTESAAAKSDGWQRTSFDFFAAPPGWVATPLTNLGGPASFAYWRQPGGKGVLTYEENGGSAGVLYAKSDHPGAAEARQLIDCRTTSFRDLRGGMFEYTCVPVGGVYRQGFLLVLDAPEGFRRVEIATSDRAVFEGFAAHVKA